MKREKIVINVYDRRQVSICLDTDFDIDNNLTIGALDLYTLGTYDPHKLSEMQNTEVI